MSQFPPNSNPRLADAGLHESDRFEVRRCLGEGAFGVVYEAFDRQREVPVALKTLRFADPRGLYALKQEFRKLADVSHHNLVTFYELGVEGGSWYISMELVHGIEFRKWVRPRGKLDPDRVRQAMRGLVTGVHALHGRGILHSDLKTSNVLVEGDGRVVILDFGLVSLRDRQMGLGPGTISGTPEFMSPEQALGDVELTTASDWYAVGTMLYQALAGRVPFQGPALSVLIHKAQQDPDPIRELAPDAPDDLLELCEALVQREPQDRPTGAALLERFGVAEDEARAGGGHSGGDEAFVGRSDELARLRRCAERAARGTASAAFVSGPSGIGKSALVRHFLVGRQAEAPATVVLSGRCFAQESVPYKGLDGVVDALHGALLALEPDELSALLPADLPVLTRAFPVLADLAPGRPAGGPARAQDEQELKLRVMRALRELFSKLAATRPIVVVIDDLQWADPDSVALLTELLRPPAAPAMTLIGMYRSEDADTSAVLQELRHAQHLRQGAPGVEDVSVGALPEDASRELAADLARSVDLDASALEAILAESAGEPFLILESVRLAAEGIAFERTGGMERRAAIDAMLGARMDRLPTEARELLDVIAVAGVPVARVIASEVAATGDGAAQALNVLRSHSMVRELGAPLEDHVETYHDRIREAAIARLEQERLVALHGRLGEALEARGASDAETLMVHFAAARRHDQATRYALDAAEQASQSLAFDHAAALYERAVELGELSGTQQLDARIALGDAYRNAGRGALAARAYMGAARHAKGEDALKLRSRAGAQYLQCGRTREGMEIARDILAEVGEHMPRTRFGALLRLLGVRARLRLRGLGFEERQESEVAPRDLLRMDTCYEVSTTFAMIDEVVGSVFGARLLLQALSAGEPARLSLAMGIEACFLAATGGSQSKRVHRLLETSESLAERLDRPFLTASTEIVRGVVLWSEGRYADGVPHCERALRGFTEDCTGVPWDRAISRFYLLYCQRWAGHLRELVDTAPEYLAEAQGYGDLYQQLYLHKLFIPFTLLVQDRPDEVTAHIEAGAALREDDRFQTHHWWSVKTEAQRLLYEGDGAAAFDVIREKWRAAKLGFVLSVSPVGIESLVLRGACALAAGDLGHAARTARKVGRIRWPWAKALSRMLAAGVAVARGRTDEGVAGLQAAQEALDAAQLPVHAAVCRRHRGVLTGDDALVAEADAALTERAVASPERFARMTLPL